MFRVLCILAGVTLLAAPVPAQDKPCKPDQEKKIVCPLDMKGAITTPLLPAALSAVEGGLDSWPQGGVPLVVCVAERRSWVGNEKVKMIIGDKYDRLAAMVEVFAKQRKKESSDKSAPSMYLAVSPLTNCGTVAAVLNALEPQARQAGLSLVGVGADDKLGLVPMVLPPVEVAGQAPPRVESFVVTVTNATILLGWNGKRTTLRDQPREKGPPVDRKALAAAVAKLQEETKAYFVGRIEIHSAADVSWDRLFQIATTVRAAAGRASKGKVPAVALTFAAE